MRSFSDGDLSGELWPDSRFKTSSSCVAKHAYQIRSHKQWIGAETRGARQSTRKTIASDGAIAEHTPPSECSVNFRKDMRDGLSDTVPGLQGSSLVRQRLLQATVPG